MRTHELAVLTQEIMHRKDALFYLLSQLPVKNELIIHLLKNKKNKTKQTNISEQRKGKLFWEFVEKAVEKLASTRVSKKIFFRSSKYPRVLT